MAKPSKMLGKGPDTPSGGRMNPLQKETTMKKVPAPKTMKIVEKSTRKAGPK
jgi:hypothetical protein